MTLRILIAAVLVALAGEAPAADPSGPGRLGAADPAGPPAPPASWEAEMPPVSAVAVPEPPNGERGAGLALAAALGRLPPGARPTSEAIELVPTVAEQGSASLVERVPVPGKAGSPGWLEVEYTIDPELDARVRRVLARARVPLGHVILMDPASGEVFSYVSTEPDGFPATRAYPTASLMKVVTAAAVLRHAPDAAGRDCRYVGSPYELRLASLEAPEVGGRSDSFWRSLAISNNQCFARLATHDVGKEALLDEMRRVGLLEAPAAQHAAGRVEPIRGALDLGHLGSGLAGSFITPLAAARLAAVLAQGELVRPFWISRVRDASGRTVALPGSTKPRRAWEPEVAEELRELLVGVTARGTARSAFRRAGGDMLLDSLRVAGKTGSLSGRNPDGRYTWFVGVAPAEAPRVAIAALVVNGPIWWSNASDVAAAALRDLFCHENGCESDVAEPLQARSRARLAATQPARSNYARHREVHELDAPPRPLGDARIELPSGLRASRASGRIVLLLHLGTEGQVLDARVDSSDLPDFDGFVVEQVMGWRFTAPTWRGQPVETRALLPIPIEVRQGTRGP
ncbi:MAG: penicillin-binding transpeptidase domain-containing protein [Myxococcota bacterium]|nr:penicillin-binding transpeptidase domain-containing protein [Myxococcota bacterium]